MEFATGSKVEIMDQGNWIGPFTVTGNAGRTPEHLVLTGSYGMFEIHNDAPFNVRPVAPEATEEVQANTAQAVAAAASIKSGMDAMVNVNTSRAVAAAASIKAGTEASRPERVVIRTALVATPRSCNQIKDTVRSLNRKLARLTTWRGHSITLYNLEATLEDSPEDLTNGGYPLVIAIRLTEPDRTLTGQPDKVWAEEFLDVNQSAVSLYRHGRVVYHSGSSAALRAYLAENPLNS